MEKADYLSHSIAVSLFVFICLGLALVGCPDSPPFGQIGGATPPTADFTQNVTSGEAPLTVDFVDTSAPGSASIDSWQWAFGDGASSTEQNPTHIYTSAGTYMVALTVTSAAGSDTSTATVSATDSDSVTRPDGDEPGEVETVILPGDVPLEMVYIPGGTFLMGRYPGEVGSFDWEDPQREVSVPGFWMGKYEVTQAQYEAVMGSNPSYHSGDDLPVEQVSWNDAKDFITALNNLTNKTFRLPSEAEWEYACRAGTTTRYYWGDDPHQIAIRFYSWYYENSDSGDGRMTHVVGGKQPNAWGLYDMSGNVWEWCEDDWCFGYADAPTDGTAWVESPRGEACIMRGGAWDWHANYSRSAFRYTSAPWGNDKTVGFRLAR